MELQQAALGLRKPLNWRACISRNVMLSLRPYGREAAMYVQRPAPKDCRAVQLRFSTPGYQVAKSSFLKGRFIPALTGDGSGVVLPAAYQP